MALKSRLVRSSLNPLGVRLHSFLLYAAVELDARLIPGSPVLKGIIGQDEAIRLEQYVHIGSICLC